LDFKPYIDKKIELRIFHFNYTRHHVGLLLDVTGDYLIIKSVYSGKRIFVPKPKTISYDIKILEEKK